MVCAADRLLGFVLFRAFWWLKLSGSGTLAVGVVTALPIRYGLCALALLVRWSVTLRVLGSVCGSLCYGAGVLSR